MAQYFGLAYPALKTSKCGFRFNLTAQPVIDIKDVRVFSMASNGILYEVFYRQDHKWLRLFAEIS